MVRIKLSTHPHIFIQWCLFNREDSFVCCKFIYLFLGVNLDVSVRKKNTDCVRVSENKVFVRICEGLPMRNAGTCGCRELHSEQLKVLCHFV